MNSRLGRLLTTAAVLTLAPMARASDDWQYWNLLALRHDFNDKVALDVASLQKWQDDVLTSSCTVSS